MNIKDTLAKLDSVLGIKEPKIVPMTKAQFDEYVSGELTKAKAEAEDDDVEKKASARKRLEHLRAVTKLLVAKSSWEGGNGTAAIPVYEFGFEPPTTLPTEESGGNMTGGAGTQADGASFAAGGGAQGYGDAGAAKTSAGAAAPASGAGTQADASFAAGGGAQSFAKSIEGLAEIMKGLAPTTEEKKPVEKAAPASKAHVDDPSVWPKDLANPAFLKEGVGKRDGEWGTDPWAAVK